MRRKGNQSSSSSTESTGNNNHLSTISSASSSQLEFGSSKLFVNVYKEGDLIGRKLDLLALGGYHDLIKTLEFMFHPTIIG
ncbi:hypothetical protein LIER_43838 [Lithospermum erythrorhizon]|uniref:Auxin-responsive protein n=1 Tax=Lithospermum erythrorhizon TaxID=34254 RepID=A0AAV3QZP4_LITER